MKWLRVRNIHTAAVLLLNVVLLACALWFFFRYTTVYQARLQEENLGNIANLNYAAGNNADALIKSWDIKMRDILLYTDKRGMTLEELLAYLRDTNSENDRQFEVIGPDYLGYLAKTDENGAFIPLDYTNGAYGDLQSIFARSDKEPGVVRVAPEFTDNYSAIKHFALYAYLPLRAQSGETVNHTLLLTTRAAGVLDAFNRQAGFDGLSTVLIDARGKYIVNNQNFKSNDFFQYLYVYNDLTLDKREEIRREMTASNSGELYYQNAMGQDCVFLYEKMSKYDWYCVTCVPISSFRTPVFNINFALYAGLMLVIMLAVDVIWLRSMNKRLRISVERERVASNAKTEFLSRMSHDIRTPLNGVIGMTYLALEEANPPKTTEYLSNIKASGNFLLGLVNDVLDMSKVESGKLTLHPEPYSVDEFCRYIEAVIAPLCAERGLDFRVSPAVSDYALMLDRLRINQVFFNLLSNAVKYTPSGGLVEFSWTKKRIPNNRAQLDFVVRDNGIGMSAEFQKHMFESFSQERRDVTAIGAGLGLSIVWNLVKLMGGTISVDSHEGEGTTFHVLLEADVCTTWKAQPVVSKNDKMRGKHALICEDNQINALIAIGLLKKWDITADVAINGKLGVERFAAAKPGAYDAIFMDVMMPEMDGLEATRAIRALKKADARTVPIIAMTANAYDVDVQNCLDAGMNAHLSKPIEPERLYALLLEYLCQ